MKKYYITENASGGLKKIRLLSELEEGDVIHIVELPYSVEIDHTFSDTLAILWDNDKKGDAVFIFIDEYKLKNNNIVQYAVWQWLERYL